MILLVLAGLCILSVPLLGGDLRALARVELRCVWSAPLALALQFVIFTFLPNGSRPLHVAVHIATYALVGLFIFANRRLPGVWLIGVGTLLNVAAILANGGVMPRWAVAQRLAGLSVGGGFHNSSVLAHPHLLMLGDVIPLPAPYPFANVLSVGDCILFLGGAILVLRSCRKAGAAAVAV